MFPLNWVPTKFPVTSATGMTLEHLERKKDEYWKKKNVRKNAFRRLLTIGQAMPSAMCMLFPLKLKGFIYALGQSMVLHFRWQNLPWPDKEYIFKVNVCYKCHRIEFLYIAIFSMKSICLLFKGVWWFQVFLPSRPLANCHERTTDHLHIANHLKQM